MDSALRAAIEEIVKAVPSGNSFDTHLVIEQIKDRHLPLYDDFVRGRELNNAHSEISCVVRDSNLVSRSPNKSRSRTVNDTYDSIVGWIRN